MLGKTPAAEDVPSRTEIPSKFPSETSVERRVETRAAPELFSLATSVTEILHQLLERLSP